MKKSLLAALPAVATTAFIAGMATTPSTFAAEGPITDWDALNTCLTTRNSTCVLGGDITSSTAQTQPVIADNVTLDLGNYTLTITDENKARFVIKQGSDVVIKGTNGKIVGNADSGHTSLLRVEGNTAESPTKLTIEKGVEIIGSDTLGVFPVSGSSGTADKNVSEIIINGNLTSNNSQRPNGGGGLSINGGLQGGPNITVRGSITGGVTGIYQAGGSVITVDGGTVTSQTAIATKAGTLNLNNTTITSTGEYSAEPNPDGGGVNISGAGIQIESNSAYSGNVVINIKDSTITSQNGVAIQEGGQQDLSNLKSIALSGDVVLKSGEGKPVFAYNQTTAPTLTIDGVEAPITTLTTADTAFTTIEETPATPETPTTPAAEEETTNPNTADSIALYATIAAVALLGLGVTALIARKANR